MRVKSLLVIQQRLRMPVVKLSQRPCLSPLDEKLVDEAIANLTGPITQIPPMYSAVKVNGRKLYEYARAGQEVERPERQVTIYQFERDKFDFL